MRKTLSSAQANFLTRADINAVYDCFENGKRKFKIVMSNKKPLEWRDTFTKTMGRKVNVEPDGRHKIRVA